MIVAVLAHEHKKGLSKLNETKGALEEINQELEERVTERTKQLEEAKSEAESLARRDFLTGLNNRMAFTEHAHILHAQSMRFKHAYCVAMIDIDHFKSINDTYGHETGDNALKVVASIISQVTRQVDIKGRIGGEEFAIFLPETTVEDAKSLAERVRESIAVQRLKTEDDTFSLNVSVGVAVSHDEEKTFEQVMARADKALYEAKNTGKNKVSIYSEAKITF